MRFFLTLLLSVCFVREVRAEEIPTANVTAQSAILMDADTGAVLSQKDPDLALPPASTTKIMTAFLLARSLPSDTQIVISGNAAKTPETALGMKAGQTFSARDLLYAMLLRSANDASVASAEAAGGTEAAFVSWMNAEAAAAGATRTHFTNPSGLPNPNHLSTARDLANITRKALQNPAFAAAARARTYIVPAHNGLSPQVLTNTNTLLETHPEITGVKTGWTWKAGLCYVGSATKGGRHYITVVLHSKNWQEDTLALLRGGSGVGCRVSGQCVPPDSKTALTGPASVKNPITQGDGASGTQSKIQNLKSKIYLLPFALLIVSALWILRGIMTPKMRFPFFDRQPVAAPAEAVPAPNLARAVAPDPSAPTPDTQPQSPTRHPFPILVSMLSRGSNAAWLDAIFATPARLLEPGTRYRAAAIFDANGNADRKPLRDLLNHTQANLRVAGAELLHPFDPKQSEAALTELADDPETAPEARAEAFRVLAETAGNRQEELFRQTLLREGLPAAALALRGLPNLTEETTTALKQALRPADASSKKPANDPKRDIKALQQKTAIACVLAEHGALTAEDAENFVPVPATALTVLGGETFPVRSEWAVSQIAAQALCGNTAAIRPLLTAGPETVRTTLDRLTETADAAPLARAAALRWLLFQEGDADTARKMAEAGDETARASLQISLSRHANFAELEPEALLAATQIVSLRQGFSHCPPGQIASLFRTSASGEPDAALLAQNPELAPLARAYSRPDVHQSVQNALQDSDGPEQLAAELTRRAEHPAFQSEIAFWADKTDRATRLPLVRALSALPAETKTPQAKTSLAERIADACLPVRRFALIQKTENRKQKTEENSNPAELDAAA